MRNLNLRLEDLMTRVKVGPEATRLMNVKVPAHVLTRLDQVATTLGAKR